MKNYKENYIGSVSVEEYVFVNLIKCALEEVMKQDNNNAKQKYTLGSLLELIKKANGYEGILDDCCILGLNINDILSYVGMFINRFGIWTQLSICHQNKQHFFEPIQTEINPFINHHFAIMSDDSLDVLHNYAWGKPHDV